MSEDSGVFDSVRLRVWRGSVPIMIHYDGRSLYLDFPRLSYFPVAYPKLLDFFHLSNVDVELEVQSNGEPGAGDGVLESHLPVGVLYDLHAHEAIPWHVTLKSGSTLGVVRELGKTVWNGLKQSELIRYGSIRRIQNLTPSDSTALKTAMLNLDFLTYWNSPLLVKQDPIKMVPVRIYLTQSCAVQELIKPRVDGSMTTVRHALAQLLPKLNLLGPTVVDIMCHGVPLSSWDLQLSQLLQEAQYVDGWIYLTLRLAPDIDRQSLEQPIDNHTNPQIAT